MSSSDEIMKKFAELISTSSGWLPASVSFNSAPELMKAILKVMDGVRKGDDDGDFVYLQQNVRETLGQVSSTAARYFDQIIEVEKKIYDMESSVHWMLKKIGEEVDNKDFKYTPPGEKKEESDEGLGKFDEYYDDEYSLKEK